MSVRVGSSQKGALWGLLFPIVPFKGTNARRGLCPKDRGPYPPTETYQMTTRNKAVEDVLERLNAAELRDLYENLIKRHRAEALFMSTLAADLLVSELRVAGEPALASDAAAILEILRSRRDR